MNFNKFPRISTYFKSKTFGFTMLELLIVIGITAVLAGVGISSYVNQQRAKLLDSTAQEIVGYFRYVQQKSMAQEQSLQWGVHFDNPSSGSDFYALYTGTTYSSPIETKYLPTGIEFQTPSSNSSSSISFNKLTGSNASSAEQEIITRLTSNQVARVIRVTSNGLITSGEGEKGYWKFDEGSGTTASDSTIYKNNGTLTNGPTWQAESNCVSGSCLSFDGVDDYVDCGNKPSLDITGAITIEAWVKLNSIKIQDIVGKGVGETYMPYDLVLNSDGTIYYLESSNGSTWGTLINPSNTLSIGEWYHIVATNDLSTARLYLNGVEIGTDTTPVTTKMTNTNIVDIGASGGTRYFNGLIDEPRIYNRALSPAEILQHYNSRS